MHWIVPLFLFECAFAHVLPRYTVDYLCTLSCRCVACCCIYLLMCGSALMPSCSAMHGAKSVDGSGNSWEGAI